MAMVGHMTPYRFSDPGTDLGGRFAAAMDRLGPFEASPHLAVALSGGADSLALAVLARDWAAARGGRVTALVVDHGLRAGSRAETQTAAARAGGLGIPAEVLTWTGDKPQSSVQAAARAARYGLLRGWCRQAGVLHLLAGHHADDQLETHLMRSGRGGGFGAAGMSALIEFSDVRLLRPLLGSARADLAAYLRARGLDWIDDPSNTDEAFERVRWRRRLAAERDLAATAGRGLSEAMTARAAAEHRIAAAMAGTVSLHPLGFARLERAGLRALSDADAALLIGRLAQVVGGAAFAPPPRRSARLAARLAGRAPFPGASLGRCRFLTEQGAAACGERIVVCRDTRGLPGPMRCPQDTHPQDTRGSRIGDWDGRFRIDLAADLPAGTVLAPLGTVGWRQIAKAVRRACGIPAPAAYGLPALFRDGALAAHVLDGAIDLRFRPKNSLAFNGFCIA